MNGYLEETMEDVIDSLWQSLSGWCDFLSCDESIFCGW